MKILLSAIIYCILTYPAIAQTSIPASGKYQNDLAGGNFKGKVKTCTSYFYEKPKDGEINATTAWRFKTVVAYNKQSNILSISASNNHANDSAELRSKYTYDKTGRIILVTEGKGKIIDSSVYRYNTNHKLTEDIWFGKNVMFHIIYNAYGRRDTTFIYDVIGKLMSLVTYYYDKAGNNIETDRHESDGKLQSKEVYQYDDRKNMLENIRIDANNNRTGKTTYQYDKNGDKIMQTDSNIIYIRGSGPSSNNKNDTEGNARFFTYAQYDKAGNWLQQDEQFNGVIIRRVRRTIEYE